MLKKIITIIILSLTWLSCYKTALGSCKLSVAIVRIELLSEVLQNLRNDIGRFPMEDEGLELLIKPPQGLETKWKGPYLKMDILPLDPWKHKYAYHYPAQYGNKDFDLYSFGVNGQDDRGEKDDITNWRDINKEYYGGLSKSASILSYIFSVVAFIIFVVFLVLLRRPSFTVLPRRFALTTSFFILVPLLWALFFGSINEISRIFIIVCIFGFSITGTIISLVSIKKGVHTAKALLFAGINITPILIVSGFWIYFEVLKLD